MNVLSLRMHVAMVGFVGTRKHLREVHGIPEELIDPEDNHGVIADHVYLHGGRVSADGEHIYMAAEAPLS